MYVESGCTVIFSAALLEMLTAYFLPRLLPHLKIGPLVQFLPKVRQLCLLPFSLKIQRGVVENRYAADLGNTLCKAVC